MSIYRTYIAIYILVQKYTGIHVLCGISDDSNHQNQRHFSKWRNSQEKNCFISEWYIKCLECSRYTISSSHLVYFRARPDWKGMSHSSDGLYIFFIKVYCIYIQYVDNFENLGIERALSEEFDRIYMFFLNRIIGQI